MAGPSECSLGFRPVAGGDHLAAFPCADRVVRGLREDNEYLVSIEPPVPCRLFIDDVELHQDASGRFAWSPGFYAGRVMAEVVEATGREHAFQLDVSPSPLKLGSEQFEGMVAEIRSYDATMLAGATPAALGFGRNDRSGRFSLLVRLARLRLHGPRFLAAVEKISRMPQQFLAPAALSLPLSRVRRLHPGALQDRRLAAIILGQIPDDADLDSFRIHSQTPVLTVDTPANRTLMALLVRFKAALGGLSAMVACLGLGGEPEDQGQRQARRLEWLDKMASATEDRLRSHPFDRVTQVETTAAGLTQIAAHPAYSIAFRLGTEALRLGMQGGGPEDLLPVSPSWGVYETWCFIKVVSSLEALIGKPMGLIRSDVAHADLAVAAEMPNDRHLQVMFQPVFCSESPVAGCHAWSLSRERRPDIVLMLTSGSERRFLILDAKYRSGRSNILEAMGSAHVYHDALRMSDVKAELCLLLAPGEPAVPSLEAPSFWAIHRVGVLSNFSMGNSGIQDLYQVLGKWLQDDCRA